MEIKSRKQSWEGGPDGGSLMIKAVLTAWFWWWWCRIHTAQSEPLTI